MFLPDVNSAVNEISTMHGLCLKTLHLNLVTEWLQPDVIIDCNSSLDDEYFNGMSLALRREHQETNKPEHLHGADDNILRSVDHLLGLPDYLEGQEISIIVIKFFLQSSLCYGAWRCPGMGLIPHICCV